jgi:hypothetical protein
MPIKMMASGPLVGPVIICDFCEQCIEDATQGNYIWNDDESGAGGLMDVYFVHNSGPCDMGLQSRMGKHMHNSLELSVLFPYLIRNLNVDMERAEKDAYIASEELG